MSISLTEDIRTLAELQAEPFDDGQHLKACRTCGLEDMSEWLHHGRHERAFGRQVHRRLDLHARQSRCLGAFEEASKILFEGLFQIASFRTLVVAHETSAL